MSTCLGQSRRQHQRNLLVLSDNLSALIFASLADLTQDQRNTLTSIMTHRGRTLAEYNGQELRDLFLEMFCATRTAVDNPMMQPLAWHREDPSSSWMKVKLMEPPAFGPKTKMMEQKVFLKLSKMFSGSMMTLNIHGINAGSKEGTPDEAKVKEIEKEKEKAEVADFFQIEKIQRPRQRQKKRPLSRGGRRRI